MTVAEGRSYAPAGHDRLLVIAPHPDDDALACGGTIALAARAEAQVRVVYMTDGGASHPASFSVSPEQLRAVREVEALAGLAALGLTAAAAVFLRARDGTLDSGDARIALRLAGIVRVFAPTIVIAPDPADAHSDHRASALLTRRALEHEGIKARLLTYVVWTSSEPSETVERDTCVVDTRAVGREKRRAIAAHRSQFGRVVRDDPTGFRIPHALITWACSGEERFGISGAP